MNKNKLIKELQKIIDEDANDYEEGHCKADDLLLKYIDDKEIEEKYNEINKWYA